MTSLKRARDDDLAPSKVAKASKAAQLTVLHWPSMAQKTFGADDPRALAMTKRDLVALFGAHPESKVVVLPLDRKQCFTFDGDDAKLGDFVADHRLIVVRDPMAVSVRCGGAPPSIFYVPELSVDSLIEAGAMTCYDCALNADGSQLERCSYSGGSGEVAVTIVKAKEMKLTVNVRVVIGGVVYELQSCGEKTLPHVVELKIGGRCKAELRNIAAAVVGHRTFGEFKLYESGAIGGVDVESDLKIEDVFPHWLTQSGDSVSLTLEHSIANARSMLVFARVRGSVCARLDGTLRADESFYYALNGVRLDSTRPFLEQGVLPFGGVTAHVQMDNVPESMEIAVKTLIGTTIACRVHGKTYTVDALKEQIFQLEGVPANQQRLIFAGQQLEDGTMLCEYKIKPGSTVHVVLKLRGGGEAPVFADLSRDAIVQTHGWSESAPDWRAAACGLCIEGECTNESCEAYGERVIDNRCFGRFDLAKATENKTTRCPMCRAYIVPLTCAFNNCEWRFNGIKILSGEACSSPWRTVGDVYTKFNEQFDNAASCPWYSLIIETRRAAPEAATSATRKFVLDDAYHSTCAICIDEIDANECVILACRHAFHCACAKLWAAKADTCPCCSASGMRDALKQ